MKSVGMIPITYIYGRKNPNRIIPEVFVHDVGTYMIAAFIWKESYFALLNWSYAKYLMSPHFSKNYLAHIPTHLGYTKCISR